MVDTADPKGTNNAKLIEEIELRQKLLDIQNREIDAANELESHYEKQIDLIKITSEIKKNQIDQEIASLKKKKILDDADKESLKNLISKKSEIEKKQQQELKALQKIKDENKKNAEFVAKQLRDYAGLVKHDEKRVLSFKELFKIASQQSKLDAIATFKAKGEELALYGAAVLKASIQFDSLAASIRKATMTSGEFDKMIQDVSRENISLAVTGEDAGKAFTSLRENFADMSTLSMESQKNLTTFTAQMEKAGFASETTARFFNTATRSMGMSTEQAKKYQKELILFASANGITNKTITEGMSNIMPKLTAFGREGPKIFKELAFQAKQTGLEMQNMLDVTERLTTYEGAAEFAGQLNALFGRQLFDTMETLRMSTEDPAAAIEMLRNKLSSTGTSFEKMSGSMKRAIAQNMGIPLEQLSGWMKKSSSEMKQAQYTEERFNEAMSKFVSIGDKWKALLGALTPAITELTTVIGEALTWVTEFVQENKGLVTVLAWIGVTIGGLMAAWATFNTIGGMIATTAGLITARFGFKTAATVADTAATSINTAAVAANDAALGINTAEAALNAAAKEGLAAANTSVAVTQGPATAAIAASSSIMAGAVIPMLAFGAAVLMAGIGALALGGGIYLAVSATTELMNVLIGAGEKAVTASVAFLFIATAIGVLAFALAELGILGSAGALVLAGLAAAALVFAISYKIISDSINASSKAIKDLETIDMKKFNLLKSTLAEMADSMQIISGGASALGSLISNPFFATAGAAIMAATIAAKPEVQNVGVGVDGELISTQTTTKTEEKVIKVIIDSPIYLEKQKLGKFIVEKIVEYSESGNTIRERVATKDSSVSLPKGGMPLPG